MGSYFSRQKEIICYLNQQPIGSVKSYDYLKLSEFRQLRTLRLPENSHFISKSCAQIYDEGNYSIWEIKSDKGIIHLMTDEYFNQYWNNLNIHEDPGQPKNPQNGQQGGV